MPESRIVPTMPARSTAREERRERFLLERWRTHGEAAARDELVRALTPLAHRCAARYASPGLEADLQQAALLGLHKALERFDPERGQMRHYLVVSMLGEVRRHLRDHAWAVRPPRGVQERVLRLTKVQDELVVALGRNPSAEELARAMGVQVEEVLEAREAGLAWRTESLDAPAPTGEGHRFDDAPSRAERLGHDDAELDAVLDRGALEQLRRHLRPDEANAIVLRFRDDLTQHEIAERLGCSQMQVSRLLRRGLGRLREEAERQQLAARSSGVVAA